jgi:hypothetical protein
MAAPVSRQAQRQARRLPFILRCTVTQTGVNVMPVVLVKYDEAITDPAGSRYFAQAAGRKRDDGLWEGWLEFVPVGESAELLTSGRETTQPNRKDLDYWAQGLSKVYLQGALARAKARTEANRQDRETIGPAPTGS